MENTQKTTNGFKTSIDKSTELQDIGNQLIMQDMNKNQNDTINASSSTSGSNGGLMQNDTNFQSQVVRNGLGMLDVSTNETKDDRSMRNVLDKPKFGLGNVFNYKILGTSEIV